MAHNKQQSTGLPKGFFLKHPIQSFVGLSQKKQELKDKLKEAPLDDLAIMMINSLNHKSIPEVRATLLKNLPKDWREDWQGEKPTAEEVLKPYRESKKFNELLKRLSIEWAEIEKMAEEFAG